jgi:hypothetical protein
MILFAAGPHICYRDAADGATVAAQVRVAE